MCASMRAVVVLPLVPVTTTIGIRLGVPGGKLLEAHYNCPDAPMGKCLFEVLPDHADACLFCGQPIIR